LDDAQPATAINKDHKTTFTGIILTMMTSIQRRSGTQLTTIAKRNS
jgi:hypothetical protein